MEIPKHFGIETYAWKVGLIKKSLRILPIIFVWFFVPKNCPDTSRQKCVDSSRKQYVQWEYWNISTQKTLMILPDENVLICLDHNMSVLLVSNIYNGNIETFLYKKLCMKTCYISKIFENFINFSCMIFWAKMFQYLIYYYSGIT